MDNPISVIDSDALIALALEKDPNHKRAVTIAKQLMEKEVIVIFPITVLLEAITALKRAANQPEKAHLINRQFREGAFHVEYVNEEIMLRASQIFERAASKQNTIFDAAVAATAENLGAESIFSFDKWYPRLGFKLAE